MVTVALVSCVSAKRAIPCEARDLYISPWFMKAKAHVEAMDSQWFILSAEYGLLHPDQVVAPYERTLNKMNIQERQEWARRVMGQLSPYLLGIDRVVVLAGERYREFLLAPLRRAIPLVEVPMVGLTIGRQLKWFGEQRK